MKKLIFSLLAITTLLSAASLKAQTADEIVSKYIDASYGGKDKLPQIKSIYYETSVQVMGNEAPTVTSVLYGKGYKSETDFNGQKIIQCYTADNGGWTINPMAGSASPVPMTDDQYKMGKDQFEIGGALFDYAAKGNKVELLGKDGNAYKLKVTTKENTATTYFIDANTYYVTKILKNGNMMGQDVEITINLSDYKKIDFGYAMPYTIQTNFGDRLSLSATVTKVEINKSIDPAIFAMPK